MKSMFLSEGNRKELETSKEDRCAFRSVHDLHTKDGAKVCHGKKQCARLFPQDHVLR